MCHLSISKIVNMMIGTNNIISPKSLAVLTQYHRNLLEIIVVLGKKSQKKRSSGKTKLILWIKNLQMRGKKGNARG